MAKAYKHIEPFEKRALSFFNQRLYEIGHNLEYHQSNLAFYWELARLFGASFDNYFRLKIENLQATIAEAEAERETITLIRAALNPCCKCEGHGGWFVSVEQDHSDWIHCTACNGSGIESKKAEIR